MNAREKFISKIALRCVNNDITFVLSATETVKALEESDDLLSVGYFDENLKRLEVATKNNTWFKTLVHEYNHLEQFLDKKSHWVTEEHGECVDDFWHWLEGERELNLERITQCTKELIKCERDCEQKTIDIFKKYRSLGVNTRLYTRQANAYLSFYGYILQNKVWYKNTPCGFYKIANMMPANYLVSVEQALYPSEKYLNLVKNLCF